MKRPSISAGFVRREHLAHATPRRSRRKSDPPAVGEPGGKAIAAGSGRGPRRGGARDLEGPESGSLEIRLQPGNDDSSAGGRQSEVLVVASIADRPGLMPGAVEPAQRRKRGSSAYHVCERAAR